MRNEIYTYFTRVGGNQLLYNADAWVRVRLRLTTAGPVDVGTLENITPVLSGKGISLVAGGLQEYTFVMKRGQRLFITAAAVNRVSFIVEPIPFLEQVLEILGEGFGDVKQLMGRGIRLLGRRGGGGGGRGGGGGGRERTPGQSPPFIPDDCPDDLKGW